MAKVGKEGSTMNTTPKVTKGTILRTILMIIVLINMGLRAMGKPVLTIGTDELSSTLETLIEIAVLVTNWWYNNSITPKARKAEEFFKQLSTTSFDDAAPK